MQLCDYGTGRVTNGSLEPSTRGKTSVTPAEMKLVRQVEEATDPLKSALELLENHVEFLQGIDEISFGDLRLRGR